MTNDQPLSPNNFLRGLISLCLQNYRNHVHWEAKLEASLVVLVGDNGAGKTNILEAISLLSPGRGLRGAKLSQIRYSLGQDPWVLSGALETSVGSITIGSSLELSQPNVLSDRRLIRINQTPIKSQSALSDWLNVVWVVPAMARLFEESGSIRRKFIDRMVVSIDPTHSERVHRYEHFLRERSHLLRESLRGGRLDDAWLTTLEQRLSEDGIAITHARASLVRQLTDFQPEDSKSPFPRFFAQMVGDVEEWCRQYSALEAERQLKENLRASRSQDAHTGGAAFGPHRGDLHVDHLGKQMPAPLCSTGEQKMLLLALTLAFTSVQEHYQEQQTLLLLDDVVAHLDDHHRTYLFQELIQRMGKGSGLQVWMTGTDAGDFKDIEGVSQMIRL